jgi:hypothetical protein
MIHSERILNVVLQQGSVMGTKCLCEHLECDHYIPRQPRTRVLSAKGGCPASQCPGFQAVGGNIF